MINNRLYRILIILLLTFPVFLQTAAAATDSTTKDLPKALQTLSRHQKIHVVKKFKTDADGINGYVIEGPDGKIGIVYTYKDFLISGVLIDSDGRNLSEKYAKEYIPKPDYAAGVKHLKKTGYLFSEGKKGAPEVYVFADPNCYYCHKFWKAMRPWVKQGKIRIHWAMVGFLKKSSPGRSAAIMAAKDKAGALAMDEQKFDLKKEEGAIAELKPVPEKYKKAMKDHAEIMAKLRFTGTPGIVYQDTKGEWQGVNGMPPLSRLSHSLGIN